MNIDSIVLNGEKHPLSDKKISDYLSPSHQSIASGASKELQSKNYWTTISLESQAEVSLLAPLYPWPCVIEIRAEDDATSCIIQFAIDAYERMDPSTKCSSYPLSAGETALCQYNPTRNCYIISCSSDASADWAATAGNPGYIANKPAFATVAQITTLTTTKQNRLKFRGSLLSDVELASLAFPPIPKTTSGTLSLYDRLVLVNSNGISLTLPTADSVSPGTEFRFLLYVTGFTLKAASTSQIINCLTGTPAGSSSIALSYSKFGKCVFTCISSGSDWIIF